MRTELDILKDIYNVLGTYKCKVESLMQDIYEIMYELNLKHTEVEKELLYFMRHEDEVVITDEEDEDDDGNFDDNYSNYESIYTILMGIYQAIEIIISTKSRKFMLLQDHIEDLNNKIMPPIKVTLSKHGDVNLKSHDILSKKVGSKFVTEFIDDSNKCLFLIGMYYLYHDCEIIRNSKKELFYADPRFISLFQAYNIQRALDKILKIGEQASYNLKCDVLSLYEIANKAMDNIAELRANEYLSKDGKQAYLLQNISFAISSICDICDVDIVVERRRSKKYDPDVQLVRSLLERKDDDDDDDDSDDDLCDPY